MYDIKLKICLRTEKKLTVGSGSISLGSNSTVPTLKIRNKPFIPGSTIKGVLRTSVIRTAPLIGLKVVGSILPEMLSEGEGVDKSLFGTPQDSYPKLFVSSAYADVETYTLYHVKIDDKKMKVEERGFFTQEYLPKNTVFIFSIEGKGLTLNEARALFVGLIETKYERFGRAGMVDLKVDLEQSQISEELKKDEIISMALNDLKGC